MDYIYSSASVPLSASRRRRGAQDQESGGAARRDADEETRDQAAPL